MASNEHTRKPTLNNHVTRFGKFTWGEDTKIRDALNKLRQDLEGKPLPTRFRIKL